VSALDAKIDELYRLPLAEFTAARNALAKSLPKDQAAPIKALEKPTVVPWTVNQVYWRARSTYDRLMKSGEALRATQIAALEGRAADVRAASEAHRRAISEAVAEGERLAAPAGIKPASDALARTFESLSLATSPAQTPGRFTEAMQPAGFEALLGVSPSAVRSAKSEVRTSKPELVRSGGDPRTKNGEPRTSRAEPRTKEEERRAKEAERLARAAAAAAERQAAAEAAEKKKHDAAVKAAEQRLERVQAAEQSAREAWERAHDELLAARQALTDVRRSRFRPS
jgi:hypothetical protein